MTRESGSASDNERRVRSHLQKIASGGASMLVGNVAKSGLQYATTIIVGRALGASVFGDFGLVMSCERFARVLGDAGLPQANLKYVSAGLANGDPGEVRRVATLTLKLSMALSLLIFAGVWLAAPLLATYVYRRPELTIPFRIAAGIVPLLSVTSMALSVPQAARNILPLVAIARVGVPLLFLGGVAAVVLGGGGLTQLILAHLAAAAAGLLAALIVLAMWLPSSGSASLNPVATRALLGFSATVCLAAVGRMVLSAADVLILARYVAPDDLGVYVAASRTAAFILLPLGAVNGLQGPVASDLYTRGDIDGLRRTYRTTTRWITGATLALFAPMLIAPEYVMRLFGSEFGGGGPLLIVVGLGQVINGATGGVGFMLTMTGGQRFVAISNWIAVVALVASLLIVAPIWGVLGGAVCVGAAFAGVNLLRLGFLWRQRSIHPFDTRYWVCGLATVAVALGAMGLARIGGAWMTVVALAGFYAAFVIIAARGWAVGGGALGSVLSRNGRRAGPDDQPDSEA